MASLFSLAGTFIEPACFLIPSNSMGLKSSKNLSKYPLQPFLHLVLTRQTRTADPDVLLITQYGIEMPVAGELSAAHADAAGADGVLGIADAAAPLDCS
jgi:hypothetical protein